MYIVCILTLVCAPYLIKCGTDLLIQIYRALLPDKSVSKCKHVKAAVGIT